MPRRKLHELILSYRVPGVAEDALPVLGAGLSNVVVRVFLCFVSDEVVDALLADEVVDALSHEGAAVADGVGFHFHPPYPCTRVPKVWYSPNLVSTSLQVATCSLEASM